MIENVHYKFVENYLHPEHFSILLSSGDYTGVVYRYGHVSIDECDGYAKLNFKYHIENVPDHLHIENLKNDSNFKNTLGDVLTNILEKNSFKIGKDAETI